MNEAGLITLIADRVVSRIMEADPSRVIVGISNRHIHLCDADFRTLFGYEAPTVRKMVRQHGEFAAEETVTLHGPKGSMPRIRVMGPNRAQTQVELSQTGVPSAIWVVTAHGRFTIAAYAAPKSRR